MFVSDQLLGFNYPFMSKNISQDFEENTYQMLHISLDQRKPVESIHFFKYCIKYFFSFYFQTV